MPRCGDKCLNLIIFLLPALCRDAAISSISYAVDKLEYFLQVYFIMGDFSNRPFAASRQNSGSRLIILPAPASPHRGTTLVACGDIMYFIMLSINGNIFLQVYFIMGEFSNRPFAASRQNSGSKMIILPTPLSPHSGTTLLDFVCE